MTFEHLNFVKKMKDIIGELKDLNKEMDTLLYTKDKDSYKEDFWTHEDLDSFESLTDEELEDLLSDEYKEATKGDE